MTPLIWALSILLVSLCAVLVFFILGQDAKGGGLAGALGGGSAQSAFGSKTTETLLKITAYLTAAFFILIIGLVWLYGRNTGTSNLGITGPSSGSSPVSAPAATPGTTPPATPPVEQTP